MSKNKRASTRRKTTGKKLAQNKSSFTSIYYKAHGKNCDIKILYKTYQEASYALKETLDNHGEIFSSLSIYRCPNRHAGFHLGHNMKLNSMFILKREKEYSNLLML